MCEGFFGKRRPVNMRAKRMGRLFTLPRLVGAEECRGAAGPDVSVLEWPRHFWDTTLDGARVALGKSQERRVMMTRVRSGVLPAVFPSGWARSLTLIAVLLASNSADAQDRGTPYGEWRYWGADAWSTRYSPLDQIDADNFMTSSRPGSGGATTSGPRSTIFCVPRRST